MRVLVRAPDLRFPIRIPVPLGLAGVAVSFIPEKTLEKARKDVPPAFQGLLTKPMLKFLVGECTYILKEYKGLEVIHVESVDSTFVSITL